MQGLFGKAAIPNALLIFESFKVFLLRAVSAMPTGVFMWSFMAMTLQHWELPAV